ncbi:MAG TPA: nitrate ABC transporter substrate-binding protein, partial [Alphaproteobacteria bacterium]|nr:nitrate ABC transporter substrate-binding protein [Alphaproteobacteria bacterium]
MASRFLGIVFLLFSLAPAAALERIVFATDWKAQAEHGG